MGATQEHLPALSYNNKNMENERHRMFNVKMSKLKPNEVNEKLTEIRQT